MLRCNLCGINNQENICISCNSVNYIKNNNKFNNIFYILEGFKYIILNKKIFRLAFLPIIITTIISIIIFSLFIYLIFSYLSTYLADNSNYNILYKIVFFLLGTFVSSIFIMFSFIPLSTLISIPFSESLSKEIEIRLLNNRDFINIPVFEGFIQSFKLLIFKLFLIVLIFPTNFIATFGNIIFLILAAIISGIDFIDLPMSLKRYTLSEKIQFINKNFYSYIFFCIPLIFLFWIPIIQIFLIPAAIIGGTKFFINSEK